MKILMVSMNSIHFKRWTNQLKDSGHEVYWFNINDGGYSNELSWVKQILGWKHRFNGIKGRIFLKKQFPKVYNKLKFLIENNVEKAFEKVLVDIKPDIVHSFALYVSCSPIFSVMNKYQDLKWVYSSWGSDLYYFQNKVNHLLYIKKVLGRVDYLFSDCYRDYGIAKQHGFKGVFLGMFPGGGGFKFDEMEKYLVPFIKRRIILIKGYQGRSGRVIPVLKAIEKLKKELQYSEIVVFGADKEVELFSKLSKLESWSNYTIKGKLTHNEVLELMGKSLIYIGNSNSDGIPNTLLEAICMGVYPIQSNPGGVTEELITNKVNGLLIENSESVEEIRSHLKYILEKNDLCRKGIKYNSLNLKPLYNDKIIKEKVLDIYNNL